MEVGGYAVKFAAAQGTDAVDVILRTCRLFWRGCLFRNAQETIDHSLDEQWVWIFGTLCDEFFVSKDEEASQLWDELGADERTVNTMLHFKVQRLRRMTAVTMVFDHWSDEILRIIEAMQGALQFQVVDDLRDAA